MTSTEKLTKIATSSGLAVTHESTNLVARNAVGDAVFSAQFAAGRFHGGYVVDRLGHVVSHETVKGMIEGLGARLA